MAVRRRLRVDAAEVVRPERSRRRNRSLGVVTHPVTHPVPYPVAHPVAVRLQRADRGWGGEARRSRGGHDDDDDAVGEPEENRRSAVVVHGGNGKLLEIRKNKAHKANDASS